MAKSSTKSGTLQVVLLLVLLIIVIIATIYWFNYIGLLNIQRTVFKLYQKFPSLKVSKEITDPFLIEKEFLEKFKISLENKALDLKKLQTDLNKKELELNNKEVEIKKKETALAQKEENINTILKQYDNIKNNLKKQAIDLTNMPPQKAVEIMNNMDILLVCDILRTINEIAEEQGEASITPYLLSLMPPQRAAQIQEYLNAGVTTLPKSY
jgi:flagellar protein FlbB